MTDADCTDDLAFAVGEFYNELTLVDGLGLKYGEWGARKCVTPVCEANFGDEDGLEVVVKMGHRWGTAFEEDGFKSF